MSLRAVSRKINKGLLIAVIGVLIGIAGLYAAVHEEKPSISMIIVNQTNVLDVRKPLEELYVSFRGEDIQKRNLNLCVITLRVENDGGVNILQNQFDSNNLWGVGMENGEIIEARLINASSDYVRSNLKLALLEGTSTIEFNKIIFERKDFFAVEILVIHDKSAEPKLIPLGKIAGIDEVQIKRAGTGVEESFIERTFFGNTWIQTTRLVCYFIVGGILIIVAVFIALGINSVKRKLQSKSRKGKIERFFDDLGGVEARNINIVKALKDIYAYKGDKALIAVREVLKKPSAYRVEMEERKKGRRFKRRIGDDEAKEKYMEAIIEGIEWDDYIREVIAGRLVEDNIIRIGKNQKVEVEKGFRRTLSELIKYLNIESSEKND